MDDRTRSARDKVLSILGDATKSTQTKPRTPVRVRGDRNVVGDGNVIVITELVEKPRVVVQPGEVHITQDQARMLKSLVDDVVGLEKNAQPEPMGYQSVWGAFNRAMGVTRYLLLPRARFNEGRAFLCAWRARLEALIEADQAQPPTTRQDTIAHIEKHVQKRGWTNEWRSWMQLRFGHENLVLLSPTELSAAYQHFEAAVVNEDRRNPR